MKKKLITLLTTMIILSTACGSGASGIDEEGSAQGISDTSEETVSAEDADLDATGEEAEADTTDSADDLVSNDAAPDQEETEETEEPEDEADETADLHGKEIIVYFPNWKLGQPGGNVEDIPWDCVTMINHAFWEVAPAGDETESSWDRRDAGLEARTKWTVRSTLPDADEEIFEAYKEYHEQYPDVKILISIGGWSRCGFFSEMAYTEEGRKSFVDACVELLKDNDWISGIDIDWEYPSGSNDGERLPEDESEQGCPIFGTALEDRFNFPYLLRDLKEGLDNAFGAGEKLLTACASSSTGWTLPNQDWKSAGEYLDYVNIMTYDMAGDWDKQPGHASGVAGTKGAMAYFIINGVDKTKLNIGIPYYGTGFKLAEATKNPVGAEIVVPNGISKDFLTVPQVKEFESELVEDEEAGWHRGYNEQAGGAYLWNDDPDSEYYCWYVSYECTDAIDGKFALIEKYDLAGVLIWEITEDTPDHEYTKYIADTLK
ncbi:glycoside hydrolase family 18 protein [Butyrivibrio sp. MC2013]|uniref:glycoside hydrolase family 18 protein n=1 Tax=Butyrivibrio sp. MC2013 TaxID=1280686 RepID=UPI000417785D|nr:glycosyl hydrolase family 18 protein [Butyrivibrio sp. MC2013]